MDVTFGAHADVSTWPAHGCHGPASFGAPVVGPAGLGLGLGGLGGLPFSVVDWVVAWQVKLAAAVGVVDMAVWDAVAKIEGKPLHRLLAERYRGGEVDEKVFVYAPAATTTPARALASSRTRCGATWRSATTS